MGFREDYQAAFSKVTASDETYRRVMNMANKRKPRRTGKIITKVLVAAVIVSLLVVTASAAETIGSWFKLHFSSQSETPLSDSQIQVIEDQEQIIRDVKDDNGWTVELRSTINAGNVGYVLFGVTAPEGVDLEDVIEDGVYKSKVDVGNGGEPLVELASHMEDYNFISSSLKWEDDGDGKRNTRNLLIDIAADVEGIDPFGPEAVWKIHIQDFTRSSDNEQYRQELMNGKYKGQSDIMFEPEEAEKLTLHETLTEGDWSFDICFAENEEKVELLSQPIQIQAEVLKKTGPAITDREYVQEDIDVTSIVLTSLTATVYYDCDGAPNLTPVDQPVKAVLASGESIDLWHWAAGGVDYTVLEADAPMVLDEVDHLLFPDGTAVPMPK